MNGLPGNGKLKPWGAVAAILIAISALDNPHAAETPSETREPASVTRAYLRAVYARDFAEAYRYVSSEDRRARNINQYLGQRGPFSGFALEIAKMLAAMVEVEIIPTQVAAPRMELTARYRAPDPEKIAALLRHWNGYQLNSLSPAERKQIIEAVEKKKRDKSLDMIAGEEKLTLVKEGDEWRIFLNWAAGVTIPFGAIVADSIGAAMLDVSLSRRQAVVQPGEVFEIIVRIKNRSQQPTVVRIGHLIQPKKLTDYLEIVQCGFLLPVKLAPGIEQEYSGTYLLRGSLPEGVHQLNLTYDFRPLHDQ
ncbi:MAG TPA: cytochrome c oxidase assembly protein [Candidatus Binatia bacterium]